MPKRRESYNYSDKSESHLSLISVILAMLSMAMIGYSIIRSVTAGGQLDLEYGLFAAISFLLAIFGLMAAINGYKDENTKATYKYLGIVLNSIMILLFIGLLILGFLV